MLPRNTACALPCLLQAFLADPKKRQERFRWKKERRTHVLT